MLEFPLDGPVVRDGGRRRSGTCRGFKFAHPPPQALDLGEQRTGVVGAGHGPCAQRERLSMTRFAFPSERSMLPKGTMSTRAMMPM